MFAPWGNPARAVVLDGRVLHLKQPPLVSFVSLLLADEPVFIVLGVLRDPADQQWLAARVLDPDGDFEERLLDEIADAVAEDWLGIKRWAAERVWREALGSWASVDAELQSKGCDVMALEPSRATSVIFRVLALRHQNTEKDKTRLQRWQQEVNMAPARTARKAVAKDTAASLWRAAQAAASGIG